MADDRENKIDEKKSFWKKAAGILAAATIFTGVGVQEAEAASKVESPKPHKQIKILKDERETFRDKIRVDKDGITIVVHKSTPKKITYENRKVQPAKIPHATPEENAKITELNQMRYDLIAQRINAKENKDQTKVDAINLELAKISMQVSEILKPIRARQQEANKDMER